MTPKEKAEELVNNFLESSFDIRDGYNAREIYLYAKQCALIAVDEVIRHTYMGKSKRENDDSSFEYWEEVKQEIENL